MKKEVHKVTYIKSLRFIYLTTTFILFEVLSYLFFDHWNNWIRYVLFLLTAVVVDCVFRLFDQYPNR